jgi:hypothetical protein
MTSLRLGDDLEGTDTGAWRPQVPLATRRAPTIRDPILEPLWSGTRVLVHFEAAIPSADEDETSASHPEPRLLRLVDEKGRDVTAGEPVVVRELGLAVLALDAVVDGILTTQATRGSEGTSIVHRPQVSRGSVFLPRDAGIDVVRPGDDRELVMAFVAIDLLRLDGQPLLDLPLLERKRLLEAVVDPSERVRVSVFTRPPVDPWVASWKAAGFRGAMLKGANGRYEPGGYAADWTEVTRLQQRR